MCLVHQEFDRADTVVSDCRGSPDSGLPHGFADLRRDNRRGGFFDEFLMTPLDGAVTLAQMDHVAMLVGQDLDLNMPRLFAILLDIDFRVAETGLGLGACRSKGIGQGCLGVDNLHAATATAGGGLDDHRETDLLGNLDRLLDVLTPSLVPGRIGTPCLMTAWRALILSPMIRMLSAEGPIKVMPHFSHTSAKLAFSDRKP